MKGTKSFLKKKTKSIKVLMSNIEIFLKKKKEKKCQHGRERFKNLEDEKLRLVEYIKN